MASTPTAPRPGTPGTERPTRFRDVFASGEFRALYAASTLSWLGDYIARAAITAMVFDLTGSIAASAAAFAISFAPWLLVDLCWSRSRNGIRTGRSWSGAT